MSTLLVIDDDRVIHQTVEAPLGGLVDRFLHATLPEEGLRMALSERPDVILLDVNLPNIDGFKICRVLKDTEATRDIPVLFLTIDRDAENLARAFDIGGSDYISKPFNALELCARVSVALRTKRAFDMLKEQARIDALTGLANRAALEASLVASVASHERAGHPVALLMIDLDDFKRINDSHGHGVGDELLRRVGTSLRACSRPYDVPCRYGGDEFVVILAETEGANARIAADRLLGCLAAIELDAQGEPVPVGASAGLATSAALRPGFAADDLMKAADRALYVAKRAGGNRLVDAAEMGEASG